LETFPLILLAVLSEHLVELPLGVRQELWLGAAQKTFPPMSLVLAVVP
jgi:hypothetical protein